MSHKDPPTRRDHFAAAAMEAFLQRSGKSYADWIGHAADVRQRQLARACFEIADAMIAYRANDAEAAE